MALIIKMKKCRMKLDILLQQKQYTIHMIMIVNTQKLEFILMMKNIQIMQSGGSY